MFNTGRAVQFLVTRQSALQLNASAQCFELIRWFERFMAKPYVCDGGKLTIGFGHVIQAHETWLKEAQIGLDVAIALLGNDVAAKEADVRSLVKVPLSQGEYDALVSFAFNVGSDIDIDTIPEGLGDSTLLRLLNAGDYAGAAGEFGKWVNARGQRLNGLVRRRAAERALFLGEEWRVFTRDDWMAHL